MPGFGTAFSRGLILGAGAALLYAAARETIAPARQRASDEENANPPNERSLVDPNRLIDWDVATNVAIRASGRTLSLHPGARAQIQANYEAILREIEAPIAAYVGNDLSLANTSVEVLDRPGWIRANMFNFRYLLQPVEDFYKESLGSSRLPAPFGFQNAARMMLSSQIGVLVGYLSRRVLGQYDIALLGEEPVNGGRLFFVEPNMRQVETTLGVPPDELRRWIALHEATHAHEFELYPWVRPYLNASLRQYLNLLIDDMRGRDT
ncbi:MAG TPA: zinc-dependent metalloprotease, partial [Chloroflexota bacterium]